MAKHIDVIEDFVCNSDNASYNRAYRLWRRHTKNAYIYRYNGNVDEKVYVEGGPQDKHNIYQAETQALASSGFLIGAALLLYLLIALVGSSVLVGVLRLFHVDITMYYPLFSMSGGSSAVCVLRIVLDILKYCLPAFMLIGGCGFSRRVVMPVRIGKIPEIIGTTGAGMVIAGLRVMMEETAEYLQQTDMNENTAGQLVYAVFDILIVSVLSEVFLHGCILTLLRQFGDGFAIALTGTIAFLLPDTALSGRICAMFIGLAGGYILIRNGSLPKCVFLRMVYTALTYWGDMIRYGNPRMPYWQYALLLMSVGLLLMMVFIHFRSRKLKLQNMQTALRDAQKVSSLLQSVPALFWVFFAVILALLQILY
ncbi:MAG: hypothetical protein MJ071_04860 [Oscillospiraceae bacterium]|nr:hypothetical protein [Oscillospiraceae bacterium]